MGYYCKFASLVNFSFNEQEFVYEGCCLIICFLVINAIKIASIIVIAISILHLIICFVPGFREMTVIIPPSFGGPAIRHPADNPKLFIFFNNIFELFEGIVVQCTTLLLYLWCVIFIVYYQVIFC